MRSVGIIAEYNPFHNGHIYQIDKIREQLNPDCIVCVMSGDFVQRGEPALIDKYSRAYSALSNGIDLVIELPAAYAVSSAETFAYGGVSLLEALSCEYVCFGSECGDLCRLSDAADILAHENDSFKELLAEALRKGLSFPAARAAALPEYADILDKPNNLLGIEYIKAIKRHSYNIKPYTITRAGNGYHDDSISTEYPSAKGIRCAIAQNDLQSVRFSVPAETFSSLNNTLILDDFSFLINYKIMEILERKDTFSQYSDISEALSNKIADIFCPNLSVTELIAKMKSRDLTYTRISRALIHILLNIQNTDENPPLYARILGFTKKGQDYLSSIKKDCPVPLITKPADYKEYLQKDIFASGIYNMAVYNKYKTVITDDYRHPVIRL